MQEGDRFRASTTISPRRTWTNDEERLFVSAKSPRHATRVTHNAPVTKAAPMLTVSVPSPIGNAGGQPNEPGMAAFYPTPLSAMGSAQDGGMSFPNFVSIRSTVSMGSAAVGIESGFSLAGAVLPVDESSWDLPSGSAAYLNGMCLPPETSSVDHQGSQLSTLLQTRCGCLNEDAKVPTCSQSPRDDGMSCSLEVVQRVDPWNSNTLKPGDRLLDVLKLGE